MKLVDNKKNTTQLKNKQSILIVNSVEISYKNSFSIDICNFENISRGRCNLKISKNSKKRLISSMYTLTNHLWM